MTTKNKIAGYAATGFILLSAISFLSVSVMAFSNPQAVMDLVNVKLNNNDAFSSIRGVYGGVGLTLFITLLYMAFKAPKKGVQFLALLWGMYGVSRIVTIFTEGTLGDFGNQWLVTESAFCGIAILLLLIGPKSTATQIA
ncbi:MAG: DUF4345 domain-containing protein [Chitinophagales bacterium]|nr:DUF4345 domain-containing protein [Chitinophagales bacterium]